MVRIRPATLTCCQQNLHLIDTQISYLCQYLRTIKVVITCHSCPRLTWAVRSSGQEPGPVSRQRASDPRPRTSSVESLTRSACAPTTADACLTTAAPRAVGVEGAGARRAQLCSTGALRQRAQKAERRGAGTPHRTGVGGPVGVRDPARAGGQARRNGERKRGGARVGGKCRSLANPPAPPKIPPPHPP